MARVRRFLDNLGSLMGVGSLGSGSDPAAMVDALLEALARVLGKSFIYVRINTPRAREPEETVRVSDGWAGMRVARDFGEALQCLGDGTMSDPPRGCWHLDGEEVWVTRVPLGFRAELGVLVAGSTRASFPEQTDRLLLEVAANQATLAHQQARLLEQEGKEGLRVESALLDAERESLSIVDAIPGLVALLSPKGDVEVASTQLLEHFGQSLEELKRWGTNGTVHPEDLPEVAETFARSVAAGQPYDILQRLRRADGAYRWMQNSGFPLRARTGEIARWCVLLTDVDDQKRAEEALRESERQARLIVDTIPGLVVILTPMGEVEFVNGRTVDYLRMDLSAAKGWATNGIVHPDDIPRVFPVFQGGVASGEAFEYEVRLRHLDGVYRWFQLRAHPLRDSAGDVAHWYVLLSDIDGLKQADAAKRDSERELRLIVDTIPGLVVILAESGAVDFENRRTREYLGPALADTGQWASNGIVHPDDLPRVLPIFGQGVASGAPFEYELRLRHVSGVYRWFQLRAHPLRDTSGDVARWYVLLSDIDEKRRAEEALRESELEFRLIVQSVAGMIAVFSPTGELNGGNQQLLDYFRQPLEEVGRWATNGMTHPDDREHCIASFMGSVASGQPYDFETRFKRFDGVYRWFQIRGHPLRDGDGAIVRWYGLLTDIDDRKRAEQHLAESEHRFRLAINALPAPAWSTRPDGYCDFLSERWLRYTGFSETQALGWGWGDAVHPDDAPRLVEKWQVALHSGTPINIEARMRRFDGEYRWFLFQDNPLRGEDGAIVRWYGACLDIEDRKRAEEALRASEIDLRLIINTISGMICLFTPDGQLEGANQQFLDYLKQSFEEASTWATSGSTHPDDLAHSVAAFEHAIATGEPYDYESRVRRFDGAYRWFHIRGQAHRDAAGSIVRWYALLVDIDDRKRAERALEASERNLRLTIDTIPALAWSVRADGTADFFNQHYLDYVGCSVAQMRDWNWTSSIHPDDLAAVERAWEGFRTAGTGGEVEARIKHHDGAYRWFLSRVNPLRDESGAVVKWYGVNTDIEDRRLAEAALKRSETFLAEGQRISATGSFFWHLTTDDLTFSEELNRIFGFEPNATVTFDRIRDRVHPDDLPLLAQKMGDVRSGRDNPEYEIRLQMADDTIKHVQVFGRVICHADGSLECLGAVQDVTQRKLAERTLDRVRSELAHVTRVMSFGALTASIAHEVNQPLSGIITNASTCLRLLALNPPNVEGAIETARRTIRDGNRASEVVAHLRKLFSKVSERSENVDLNEAAAEVVALLSSDLQRNQIVVHTDFADCLPTVPADRVQLQQVIVNLLVNASDAMSAIRDRQRQVVIRTNRDGDQSVRLSVQDAGVGIDIEDPEKIFQPFFTTKRSGMGIGLSLSRTIIESHSGRIWVEPNADGGATFAFTIPVILREAGTT
ncbi:PAS domain-containing sensor histidine kinase [Variovorax saccharolyticus]|uniref:PAS domain-containing sensor histidine kinase n=1 Tax=Variovorax saccharolyticus TaxID=3053516 RepID=UPI00257876C3|nr:PAS domain-containing protein [Variovorax sp. J22R187]MDM0022432.1 PAS domain-containing protein [Variovorax sp. J22R187]